MRLLRSFPLVAAPGLLGALFLSLSGCGRENGPDWENQAPPPAETAGPAQTASPPLVATLAEPSATETSSALPGEVRFVVHNVRNWLTMERGGQSASKPDKEKRAVISLLVKQQPDIVGLCEIGGESDVAEIQRMLEAAGHPLPHRHVNGGSDPTRRLALISRHPIPVTKIHTGLEYRLNGKEYAMLRGILDATVETPAGSLRFLGAHLKSKRETDEGDQEEMRRNEAHLLRREIDAILRENPQAPLVVYGDLNDTRQSPSLRTIHGPGNSPRSLMMIALKDSRGEYWTHHWAFQDIYSRLDYVLVGRSLRGKVLWDDCRVVGDPEWADASDHRPLLVVFKR